MTPSARDLPVVTATFHEMRRQRVVKLPGGLELPAADESDVEALVRRYAPSSAIRYVRVNQEPPGAVGAIQPAEAGGA